MMVAEVCMFFFILFFLTVLVWRISKRIEELELNKKALWETNSRLWAEIRSTGRELRLWRRKVTTMKDDTISRQALLDAVDSVDWYHQNKHGEMVLGANSDEHQAWYKAEDIYKAIESVPPVQLAQDLPKGCTDTISRQAAIEAMRRAKDKSELHRMLVQLPSAQPVVISKLENATECEDAVSRFEVLRLIDYSSNDLNDSVDNWYFQGKVKELPSVTPKQRGWIPCTPETMPPDYQWYYATCKSLVDNRENWVVEGCYTPWEHFDSTPMIKCGEAEVIAWMPKEFPEPWEGGQE